MKTRKRGLGSIAFLLMCLLIVATLLMSSCKTQYVPIETTKTEYKDRWQRDSIHLHDSIFVKQKGDTVWLERYKTLYKEKLVQDSIYITDTIRVPYPVVEYKEANKLTSFQTVCVWLGKILLGILGLGLIIGLLKWKRLF